MTDLHKNFLQKSYNIKKRFLGMYKKANTGHVGSSLSVAEILTFVRFFWMDDSDEIILSKGHAAAALYSILAEEGILSEEEIATFYGNDTYLAAHPPVNKLKRVPFATGSLGHGLSLAAGMGLAQKLRGTSKKIFCITSDGELNEGSTWEAIMFVAHQQLKNVVWFIDRNMFQGYGHTEEVMKLEPLDEKLKAFGFSVLVIDGHSYSALESVKEFTKNASNPVAIICNTVKGRGWEGMENTLACHYDALSDEHFEKLMLAIAKPLES